MLSRIGTDYSNLSCGELFVKTVSLAPESLSLMLLNMLLYSSCSCWLFILRQRTNSYRIFWLKMILMKRQAIYLFINTMQKQLRDIDGGAADEPAVKA